VGGVKLEVNTPYLAMSEQQLQAFQEAVKADVGLQEQLKEASDAHAVVAIAKTAGFEISVGQLVSLASELSDEELEKASGGFTPAFVTVGTIIAGGLIRATID
jgi:predicted ribosomally synthesized peptide with nif11-like leader